MPSAEATYHGRAFKGGYIVGSTSVLLSKWLESLSLINHIFWDLGCDSQPANFNGPTPTCPNVGELRLLCRRKTSRAEIPERSSAGGGG
jgi:hypothetical protein